jgi:hypothetical protein
MRIRQTLAVLLLQKSGPGQLFGEQWRYHQASQNRVHLLLVLLIICEPHL